MPAKLNGVSKTYISFQPRAWFTMKGTTPHLARARAANQMYLVNLLIDVLDKDLVANTVVHLKP